MQVEDVRGLAEEQEVLVSFEIMGVRRTVWVEAKYLERYDETN